MKNTSRKAYEELKQSNYLTKKQREVMEAIVIWGPITQSQLDSKIPHAHKRVAELEAMGLVRSTGTVVDPLTHKSVYRYEATGDSPRPVKKIVKPRKRTEIEYLLAMSDLYDRGYIQRCMDEMMGLPVPEHLARQFNMEVK
jgi:hypothetical protein